MTDISEHIPHDTDTNKRLTHIICILVVATLILVTFRSWLPPFNLPQRGGPDLHFKAGDLTSQFSVWSHIIRESISKHHSFPLWNPYIYCGTPFFAKSQTAVLSISGLLTLFMDPWLAVKYSIIIHLILGGVGMYLLMRRWLDDSRYALISAIAFSCNFYAIDHALQGHANIINGLCWLPFIVLMFEKGQTAKRWLRYAVWTGLLVALQIWEGAPTLCLYTILALAVLTVVRLLTQLSVRQLRRAILFGSIAAVVFAGLIMVRWLPSIEMMALSNRQGGIPLKHSRFMLEEYSPPAAEIFVIVLVFVGVLSISRRRKTVLPSLIILGVLGYLIGRGTVVYDILWKYMPGFSLQRLPQRGDILLCLAGAALAGFAGEFLDRRLLPRLIGLRRNTILVYALLPWILAAAVAAELYFGGPRRPPTADIRNEIASNHIMQYLSKQDTEPFRIHLNEIVDRHWGTEHVTVPLGLQVIFGEDNLWHTAYMPSEYGAGGERAFLAEAREGRAKLWGMLNVRYMTSATPAEIDGFELVKKFPEEKTICQPGYSDGPYLYENTRYLPRAYVARHAVLVAGKRPFATSIIYDILLDGNFHPANTVVLSSPTVTGAMLDSVDAIIATDSSATAGMDSYKLQTFRERGGRVYQSTSGKLNADDKEKLAALLRSFGGDYSKVEPVQISRYSPNEINLLAHGQKGFLVLSEKYAIYPGWRVETASGDNELLVANGVLTAIRLDGTEEQIEIRYLPLSFVAGAGVSGLTMLIIIVLAVWFYISKKSRQQSELTQA